VRRGRCVRTDGSDVEAVISGCRIAAVQLADEHVVLRIAAGQLIKPGVVAGGAQELVTTVPRNEESFTVPGIATISLRDTFSPKLTM
jgi:hypothetical protein